MTLYTLSRSKKIAKLPLPYRVTYRLFVALVSSCYNHFALSCDITPSQNKSLKHAVTSILVPKRSQWVCREALYSLNTPGHLLSPKLFLNYRHIIEYLLYVRQTGPSHRGRLSALWINTLRIKWGPFFSVRVMLLKALRLPLKILFSFLYIIPHIQLTTRYIASSILLEILIVNTFCRRRHYEDTIVKDKLNQCMSNLPVLFTYLKPKHYIRQFCGKF